MKNADRFEGVIVTETLRRAEVLVLAVGGEIDIATAPALQQDIAALLGEGVRHLLLDFSEVGFCDSSGLNVLLGFWRDLHDHDGSLALTGAPHGVERALCITGLDQSIALYPDLPTALKCLGSNDTSSAADVRPN